MPDQTEEEGPPHEGTAGVTRVDRVNTLHARLADKGMQVSVEHLDGVGHQVAPIVDAACHFLAASASFHANRGKEQDQ